MLVYQGDKKKFIDDVDLNIIVDNIHEEYKKHFGKSNEAQIRSWQNSMQFMRGALSDIDIPQDAGIAIEFNIPATSKRVDFIISGKDKNKNDSVIIIELKQWDDATAILNKDAIVKTYVGHGIREVSHPSYQALSYATLINDFNESISQDNIGLYPCAFLHNYDLKSDDDLLNPIYSEYVNQAPLFGKSDVLKLRNFIKSYVKYGDKNKELLYKIENGRIKPSKMLQDTLSSMLEGNEEFMMIDDQKVIYEEALLQAIEANKNQRKQVMIIEGGPGTGKSVLAVNLLIKLLTTGLNTRYVTKNKAPRDVFSNKLSNCKSKKFNLKEKVSVKNIFMGSGSFCDTYSNNFDALIVDEAHRLNEKSGLFSNLGENQIKEIINASYFSIFFIDENQKVTLKDIGSIDEIEFYANYFGAYITKMKLESQFRCNGSDGYLAWLDNTLNIRKTANYNLLDFNYDFKVFDNPSELRDAIIEKNKINNKSRIVAGYCWNWISEGKNNTNIHDIVIDDFEMSWNLGNSSTWAIDENSINEAGCIHTCQGLEFDYVGVIIGPDILYKNDEVTTDYTKRATTDKSLSGIKKLAKKDSIKAFELSDVVIKNTYRTLMTRGMKGCYIYCTDKNLSEYFKRILNIK